MLSITGLVKNFNDLTALDGMSFTVEDGEFFALLGPSASGKTTTLRRIAGLESPSRGEVRIGGQMVDGLKPSERNIAMVFQFYALYPGQVDIVEPMGAETPVHLPASGPDIRVVVPCELSLVPGERLHRRRRPGQAQIFDDNGERVFS